MSRTIYMGFNGMPLGITVVSDRRYAGGERHVGSHRLDYELGGYACSRHYGRRFSRLYVAVADDFGDLVEVKR